MHVDGLKGLNLRHSFLIYFLLSSFMFFISYFLIPYLSNITKIEVIFFWFLVSSLFVFFPLLLLSYIFLKKENRSSSISTWVVRLRFRKLNLADLKLTLFGIVLILVCSGLLLKSIEFLSGPFNQSPSFMMFKPIVNNRYWILFLWFPSWILNIMGEEIFWRGLILPRQELNFGKYAWLIHGIGWSLFHIAFGWQLLITLFPLIFIQSYIVQKTRNSWTGVIIHAGISGPGFIAMAFGLV